MKIGVFDIGGTHTRAFVGEAGEDGERNGHQWTTIRSYEGTLRAIEQRFPSLKDVDAVAISIGAQVNPRGEITASNKFPDFVGKPLRQDLEERLGLSPDAKCYVAHDCVCALVALQQRYENANAVGYVTFSTGLGGAYAKRVGKQIYVRRVRIAHQTIDIDGPLCSCGRRGCAAAFLDSEQLKEERRADLPSIDDDAFWERYRTIAVNVVENIAILLNLEKIYIGGGVVRGRPDLATAFGASVKLSGGYGSCDVEVIKASNFLPLDGAFRLAKSNQPIILE